MRGVAAPLLHSWASGTVGRRNLRGLGAGYRLGVTGAEVVQAALDAWELGGLEAWSRWLHPEVRWDTTARGADGGVVHGPAAVLKVSREWLDAWGAISFDMRELREAGDQLAGRFDSHARGKGSGVEGDIEWFASFRVRDDKVIDYREHSSWPKALEAIGLSD
jgi:ketosteroid isomerase-like protein